MWINYCTVDILLAIKRDKQIFLFCFTIYICSPKQITRGTKIFSENSIGFKFITKAG